MSTEAGTALGSLIGADRAGVVCARKFDEVRLSVCALGGWVEGGSEEETSMLMGGGGELGLSVW